MCCAPSFKIALCKNELEDIKIDHEEEHLFQSEITVKKPLT
jgi:hypothetical protein